MLAWGDVRAAAQAEREIRHNEFRAAHPHLSEWAELGRQLTHPYHWPPSEQPRASESIPDGTCRVQVLRSAADWSHGILLEDSIQRACNHVLFSWLLTVTEYSSS
jgi:phospholipase D1/2